jgi:hypothetical protein
MMVVTATFESGEEARAAIEAVLEAGYTPDQISAVIPEPREVVKGHHSLAGALKDSLIGGVTGTLVATAATGLLGPAILPGVGAATVAGVFVPIGAMLGTIAGTLVELGHEPESAHGLYREVVEGRSMVTVQATGDDGPVADLFWAAGAIDVSIT